MNALLRPDSLFPTADPSGPVLPDPEDDAPAQRYVWESRFGPIVIEVHEGSAFVNGVRVEPAEPAPAMASVGSVMPAVPALSVSPIASAHPERGTEHMA